MSKSPNEPEPCQCAGDEFLTVNGQFWCERHKCWKTQHYHKLCQTRHGYRQLWGEGRGPGQATTPRPSNTPPKTTGPGDILRKMLGCSGKRWPHYEDMNTLGELCEVHLEELVQKLSEFQGSSCNGEVAARRMITLALDKWRSVSCDRIVPDTVPVGTIQRQGTT